MGFVSHPSGIPGGEGRDGGDQRRLRHARQVDMGFGVGRYLQPPPMLFTRDGHNLFLGDMYRGQTAFLICSGPSLKTHDLSKLQDRGFITMSVNNAATVVPTRLWVSVDDPGNFSDLIWRDPGITKFVPLCHMEKTFNVRDEDNLLIPSIERVGDMPAVIGYRRNENFVASQWLYEDTFNWGNRGDKADEYGNKGARSVMYVALRLLFFLGIRRVYLLGCDFKMEVGAQNYAFPQERTVSSVRGNNSSYRILNARFEHLKPYFAHEGFEVFNCTPSSGLTVFPHVPFETAIKEAAKHLPSTVITEGMYDRKHVRPVPSPNGETAAGNSQTLSPANCPPNAKPPAPQKTGRNVTAKPHNEPGTRGVGIRETMTRRNQATETEADLAVTVVTTIDESLFSYWMTTSRSWKRYKPSLARAPWLIGYDPHWRGGRERLTSDNEAEHHRLVAWPSNRYATQREKCAASWPAIAAAEAKTPWVLYLAADTLAEGEGPWHLKSWLTVNSKGKSPVLVTSPFALSSAHEERDSWNRWGNEVPRLSEQPGLEALTSNPIKLNGAHRTSPWFCLIETSWLRDQWRVLQNHPSSSFPDLFLHACAARRRDYVVSVNPELCRWQNIAGRPRLLRERRSRLMAH